DSLKKNHQIHEENGMLSCTNSETNSWVTGSITAILSVIFSAAMATTTLAWQAGAQAVLSSWPLTSGASNLIAWVIAGMLLASEIMFCVSLAYTLSQKIQMTQDKNAQHTLSLQSIVIGIFTFILPACMISLNAYANGIIAESTLQHYQFLFIALGTCLSLSIMSNAVAAFDKNAIIPSKIPNTAQQFSSTMQTHFKYLLAFTVISCAYYLGPFTNGMIQPLITQPNVITLISITAPFILISICFALKTLYQNLNTELTISHPLHLTQQQQQQQQQQQPLPPNPQQPENRDRLHGGGSARDRLHGGGSAPAHP
ncbi:MAG: hypothetical protein CMF51_02830, partial [Legionellales bacterium]|nr:hypothetical protein [Legionellales bacterium]